MKRWILILAGTGLSLIGITFLLPIAYKSVTILIEDDPPIKKTTFGFTTSQILAEMRIPLYKGDEVDPNLGYWLHLGETIRIRRATWVYVAENEREMVFLSTERLPANLLAQAGIKLYPGDQLFVDGELALPDRMLPWRGTYSLQIIRAEPFTIEIDGKRQTFYTSEQTVGKALERAGFEVKASDRVSLPLDAPIERGTTVIIERARPIAITSMGKTIRTLSSAKTVGEALTDAGVALQGLDYSHPTPGTLLAKLSSRSNREIKVEVFRVQDYQLLEKEFIPFETEIQLVDDLEIDKTKIIQPGAFGMKVRRIRVRSIDGQEISREVEDEYTAIEPQNEIKGYGKKLIPHTLETPDGTITYWRALNMYAVSYKPSSSGNFTSIGLPLRRGIVAVDTDYIAYGTRMYIPGYGFAIAGDTGGGVVGRLIDLGYSDEDYVSWHQWVTVYFLWPPPEVIAWIYP